VRGWLHGLATRLGVANPAALLGTLLDRTFDRPPGDPSYGANTLVPGAPPLEVSYSEREPAALRLDAEPFAPNLTPTARRAETIATVAALTRAQFGEPMADRFAAAVTPWIAAPPVRFGAFFGAALDAAGLAETTVYLEMSRAGDALPDAGRDLLRLTRASLPGVAPLMHAVAAGPTGVSERLSLACLDGLRLLDLVPLLDRLDLTDRLPALLDAAIPLSGGRFDLPPGTAVIGLRRVAAGFEIKLEILVACLPVDALAVTDQLLVDRPASAAAFRRWCVALAGDRRDIAPPPGAINVVSVRVGPRSGPEINVYLRPAALAPLCAAGRSR
jgi:hypothetical protein